MKRDKKLLIITTMICLVPIIWGLSMYNTLPENIATHFDGNGNVNGYMPKDIAIWLLPLILAGINTFTHFILNSDPKRANASIVIRNIGLWTAPVLSTILVPTCLFKSIGYDIPVHVITIAITGVLIVITGNYLPKCKKNYTVGIKLPWTLNNEENWNKTHRLAGYVWIIGGVVMIFLSFFNVNITVITLLVIALLVLIPTIYSYGLYKKSNN